MSRDVKLLVDLGYGDAGKGAVTDFLARKHQAHTVVRFGGGAQCGHNVETSAGQQHVFQQFGSGMFVPGVRSYMSRFTILRPLAILEEEMKLRRQGVTDAFTRSYFDERALVATPMQSAVNRLLEIERGDARHGSCGMGIGQAVFDAENFGQVITMGDHRDPHSLRLKLRRHQEWKREQSRELIERCRGLAGTEEEIARLEDPMQVDAYIDLLRDFIARVQIVNSEKLDEFLREDGTVILEPHQGVLLDRWRGFMPYCTPSVCTFENAEELLDEHHYDGDITRLGITRAYMVRHGPGPFVSEDGRLTERLPDTINGMHQWQRGFRVGPIDTVALRYAIASCDGVDELAVTCLDRLRAERTYNACTAYDSPDTAIEELKLYFHDFDEWEAAGIGLGPRHDLNHQYRLTELLNGCSMIPEPVFWDGGFENFVSNLLALIERDLSVPVTITGFGPTAVDYRFR